MEEKNVKYQRELTNAVVFNKDVALPELLMQLLRNTWTESTSKEDLHEEFRRRYILVEYDSVSEFPLILDVLLFHFKCSKLVADSKAATSAESGSVDTGQSSATFSDASKTDDKIETASLTETSSQRARPLAASQITTSETGSKHKTAHPTRSPAKTSKTIPTTKKSSSRSESTVTSQTKTSTKRTTTTTAKNSSALSGSAITSHTTKSTKTKTKSPKETSPVMKSQSKKSPPTNPLVITVTQTGHYEVQELRLPSPVPSLPSSSTPATNSQSKKRVFQKIEWCEEGEIISDEEESQTYDFRHTKNYYKTMRPVHERFGHDRDGTTSTASAFDIEKGRVDDATSFKPEIAELKAALSEILFMQPGRRTTVDNLSAIYRSHFYKSIFPEDHGFSVNSTSNLLFSLNLFSFKWNLGEEIVIWNQGKFLANFKANAEDLLQAKRSIQVFQFLPTYMKIFGHKVTAGLFLEMCGYPSTSELLRACCPSIWVPDFDHQRLQFCDETDNSDFEEIDFGYEKKICYYFQNGWCKFGHTCRNIH